MLPNLVIHHDPEGINTREIIPLEIGANLLSALMNKYGANGFTVPTKIYLGDCIDANEIDQKSFIDMARPLKENEIINVIHRPQGAEVIFAVVVAILAIVLQPDISPPPAVENPNFPKINESPNNQLTGQTNLARPLGRIPDVYGRMRVYPDLGIKTVEEFIDHVKQVTEYLIIGRGQYLLEEIKSGETLIENISGTDITLYEPYSTIPELVDFVRSNEINGQELKSLNQDIANEVIVTAQFRSFPAGDGQIDDDTGLGDGAGGVQQLSVMTIGDQFSITGSASNNGLHTYGGSASYTESEVNGGGTFYSTRITTPVIASPSETFTAALPATSAGSIRVGPFVVPSYTEEVWVDVQAPRGLADRTGGLSNALTISIDVILERLDEFGVVLSEEISTFEIVGNTLDPRFYTFKIIPDFPSDPYQVTMTKNTATVNDSGYYDLIKWTSLAGVRRILFYEPGNVTSYLLKTKATSQATSGSQRKFNAVVTRKLASYDNGAFIGRLPFSFNAKITSAQSSNDINFSAVGVPDIINLLSAGDKIEVKNDSNSPQVLTVTSISYATIQNDYTISVSEVLSVTISLQTRFIFNGAGLQATTKMADALLSHMTDPLIGNKKTSDLDLAGLYSIQNSIDNTANYDGALGRFSYSFSSEKSSVKDELITIANSCRVYIRKIGNRLEFGRDEVLPFRTTLFNGRNKKPSSEKKTIRLQKANGFDGIELQWSFEDTSEQFTINLPDGKNALNPKRIDAAGIKNFRQAWNRASIEFEKIKLQRESLELTVTKEGLLVQVGDRVANSDGTDIKTQAGEIKSIGVSANQIITFDKINFKGELTGTVILRSDNGIDTFETQATPLNNGGEYGFFIASLPLNFSLYARGDQGYQVGTLYSFFTVNDVNIADYVIQKIKPKKSNYVGLTLTNYNENIYLADTQDPPEHETYTKLIISNIQIASTGFTDFTVTWDTNIPADSVVNYGLTSSYGSSASNLALVTPHSITVSGLESETLYNFNVESNGVLSANQTVTTDPFV